MKIVMTRFTESIPEGPVDVHGREYKHTFPLNRPIHDLTTG